MSLLKSSEPQISCFLQVISRLPVQQQRSCETLQHRPAIIKLHHRFRATFVDAHEEHIASIAVTLARGHAFHYPPDLGNMLLEALSTLHEPTGKVQALVLDACAKMHCKGVRGRLLSRAVSRPLTNQFQGWDMQAISMYVQSISSFGYTSKVTYRQAAAAALDLCHSSSVPRGTSFMKSLSLLLWALAKSERTMSAPASALFSIAAEELLSSSYSAGETSNALARASRSTTLQPVEHLANKRSYDAMHSAPQASQSATCNMKDSSLLLWALVVAAQARVKQNGGFKDYEWRGSHSTASSGHASITTRSKDLLRKHWAEVPVIEAVTAKLEAISQAGAPVKVLAQSRDGPSPSMLPTGTYCHLEVPINITIYEAPYVPESCGILCFLVVRVFGLGRMQKVQGHQFFRDGAVVPFE